MGYEINSEGTVSLGFRKVAVPHTVSDAARDYLSKSPWGEASSSGEITPMWAMREFVDAQMVQINQFAAGMYPVNIEARTIAGVKCQVVTPKELPEANRGRVLLNMHSGGFVMGGPAITEAIPIANLAKLPVIAIDYRLAPEHRFPAAVDDVMAVYREVLKDHQPSHVGIYGSSAGGFITGQTAMRIKKDGLPLPACLGVFTGGGNLGDFGDTAQIFSLAGFWGDPLIPLDHPLSEVGAYLGNADRKDPLVSPIFGNLEGLPPTLLMSGTRDAMLSSTALFHRALRRAGVDADLFVFEAMPHAHWYALHLPESREAFEIQSRFFGKHLLGNAR